MRFTKLKKEIKGYFDKKIEKQEIPGDIDIFYNRAVLDKSPERKRAWIWKPAPVFGILLVIVFFGFVIRTTFYTPPPTESDVTRLEKIFSQMLQLQVKPHTQEKHDKPFISQGDDFFMLEMTIKNVLFSMHNERYTNEELAGLFKRVLSFTPTIKKKETITYPDWESSHISDLENRIKKMIEEKQVYRSLIRINKS